MSKYIFFLVFIRCSSENTNHCDSLKIGQVYTIQSSVEKNPFKKQPIATVEIMDIKNGYVQYRWQYDTIFDVRFSRTCEEFNRKIELRKEITKQK